jgi:hypothetical protein
MDPVSNYTELRKKPLGSYTDSVSEVIQITPQEVHLSLRISEWIIPLIQILISITGFLLMAVSD